MDYKHKDALDRARNLHKDAIDMGAKDVIKICEIIFPELAKSEDERIREELIKHLKEGAEGYLPADDNDDYQRWLDWLEKQGKGSLTALLAQMPCVELVSSQENHYRAMWKNKISEWYDNAVDACMELIERAREEDKE